MNDLRKNHEEETEIIRGTFKVSPGAILGWLIGFFVLCIPIAIPLIIYFTNPNSPDAISSLFTLFFFGPIFLIFNIFEILRIIGIHKNEFVVTNKRIYGIYHILISKKNYSYRLDEIENVEMNSTLGCHTLALQFSQGKGPSPIATTYVNGVPTNGGMNVFKVSNLKNYKDIYAKMVELLGSVKNVLDLQTDIEMSKIDVENRKADALENVAKNIAVTSTDSSKKEPNKDMSYIVELKELKKLLDEGIITQEEFDQEKKEILENNHK